MQRYSLLVLSFGVLLIASCELLSGNDRVEYAVVAFDSTGIEVARGVLQLRYQKADGDEPPITGTWDLHAVNGDEQHFLPIGEGHLVGYHESTGEVSINLHPDFNDNNAWLRGRFESGRSEDVEGEWYFTTFVGHVNGGRFEAHRQ